MHVQVKRVYDDQDAGDGYRVLIDRLWPRGVSKDAAHLNDWWKVLAPSTELRQWFDHDPDRWEQFQTLYEKELSRHEQRIERLLSEIHTGTLTLLTAAPRPGCRHAEVLAHWVEQHMPVGT